MKELPYNKENSKEIDKSTAKKLNDSKPQEGGYSGDKGLG